MGHCKRLMALISFIATGGAQWAQIGRKIFRVAWVFWKKLGCSVDFGYKQIVHYYLHCCVLLWIGLFLSYFIPLCGAFRMYIEHTILSQTKLQRHLNGFMWYIIKNSLLNEQSKWNEYFFLLYVNLFFVLPTHLCVTFGAASLKT